MKAFEDEIIAEVRANREAYAAQFNYDLHAMFADIKKRQAQRQANGVVYVQPPPPAAMPNTALQRSRFARP